MIKTVNVIVKYLSFTHLALLSLMTRPVRTFLLTLGIVIGVASIIVAFSVGAGGKRAILYQIDQFGIDVITLSYDLSLTKPKHEIKNYPITDKDFQNIKKCCPSVIAAAPLTGLSAMTKYNNKNRMVRIYVTD